MIRAIAVLLITAISAVAVAQAPSNPPGESAHGGKD
jgi:hypothetical protein